MRPMNFKVIISAVVLAAILGILNNMRVYEERRVSVFGLWGAPSGASGADDGGDIDEYID